MYKRIETGMIWDYSTLVVEVNTIKILRNYFQYKILYPNYQLNLKVKHAFSEMQDSKKIYPPSKPFTEIF
jgi:hypothetical protein